MSAHTRKLAQILLVAAVASAAAACDIAVNGDGGFHFAAAAGKAQDEWTRSYKLAAGGRIELINVNGTITAEASPGETLEVRAERTARAINDETAKDVLSRIEMREEAGETRVRIEVRPPRLRGPSGHEFKWTLKIPKGIAVDLRTVNGGVKLLGLQGEIRARATNGGVTGSGLDPTSIDASVVNGGVEIALARPPAGTIELEAVNGGVDLALPAESKADISARCVNGGITVTGLDVAVVDEESVRERKNLDPVKTFKRRLDGKLNGGGARVSLETVNGGVKITRATT